MAEAFLQQVGYKPDESQESSPPGTQEMVVEESPLSKGKTEDSGKTNLLDQEPSHPSTGDHNDTSTQAAKKSPAKQDVADLLLPHGPTERENASEAPEKDDKRALVFCCKCNLEKPAEECTKKNKKYLCRPCNSAASTLSKTLLGGFDGRRFSDLEDEAQQKFWRDAAGASKAELSTLYESTLQLEKERLEKETTKGSFYPLSYWQTQGFDIERIRTKSTPEDIREHAVLGTTYRVHIDTSTDQRVNRMKETSKVHGQADHGVAKPDCFPASKSKKNPVPKALTPRQQEQKEKKVLKANTGIVSEATKIATLYAPAVQKAKTLLEKHAVPTEPEWQQLLDGYHALGQTLTAANALLQHYGRSPLAELQPLDSSFKDAKAVLNEYQGRLAEMLPKRESKRQRKA